MDWLRARQRLMATACLDAAGLIGLGMAISRLQGLELNPHSIELLLLLVVIYCSFGWLLGTYTLLKVPRVSWTQILVSLGGSALASIAAAALIRDVFRLEISSRLIFGSNLLLLFPLLTVWSALIRLLLRHYWRNQPQARWQILALPTELDEIESEWPSNQPPEQIRVITNVNQITPFVSASKSQSLALSCGVIGDRNQQLLCQNAVDQGIPMNSIVELAEQELQRIPPRWVGNQWILFSNRIDGTHSTVQKQLKRYADVLGSISLLILSAPLILVAGLLVKLQDGGPVLYRQQRSGLLGQPFQILKIRTMITTAEADIAQWARVDDQRITPIGRWLRKTRLDELPQLLNVLQGDMSLIGPRPERPEIEKQLEEIIPNYRLRHWIRPGLSGWAQVNMHYASNFREAELKLSYDLYYLRNSNILLDLLIIFKTIKIILKAAGR